MTLSLKQLARSENRTVITRLAQRVRGWQVARHWKSVDAIRGGFYRSVFSTEELHAYLNQKVSLPDTSQSIPETIHGTCYVCDQDVDFEVNVQDIRENNNWRETLRCPSCELINRWRSSVHLFERLVKPQLDDRIYLTESITVLYKTIADRFPNCTGSEYAPDTPLGTEIQLPAGLTRIEDVTRLTFADASFEAILSFDVLEHVPDYQKALHEFYRVLSPGGQILISVPSTFNDHTVTRAELDAEGNIHHLLEPRYHGDPLSDEGVLCYQEFGLDLLQEMKNAGFRDAYLVCYTSEQWGYHDAHLMFVGRKG